MYTLPTEFRGTHKRRKRTRRNSAYSLEKSCGRTKSDGSPSSDPRPILPLWIKRKRKNSWQRFQTFFRTLSVSRCFRPSRLCARTSDSIDDKLRDALWCRPFGTPTRLLVVIISNYSWKKKHVKTTEIPGDDRPNRRLICNFKTERKRKKSPVWKWWWK